MTLATDILGAVGKMVASAIFGQITNFLFKPDPLDIDAILAGQQKIIDLITELDYKSQVREPMNLIYYWTGRMQEVVDDVNRTNSSQASLDAYNELITALRSESSGIRYQTFTIYNAIMGIKSPLGTDGMLLYWEQQAYKKLGDEGNFSYFMADYIGELDTDIAAVFALLHHGLELSYFVAIDSGDADRLKSECTLRMTTIRDTLFNNYPPLLRTFREQYDPSPVYYIAISTFGFIANPQQILGFVFGDFMCINDFWIRVLGVESGNKHARLFYFKQGTATGWYGALQLHTTYTDSGNSRIKYYKGLPDGLHVSQDLTNTPTGGTTDILFKVIPLKIDTTTDYGKLVPFQDGTTSWIGTDDNNTMGHNFLFYESDN